MKRPILLLITIIVSLSLQSQNLVKVSEVSRFRSDPTPKSNTFTGYFNITDFGFLIGSPDNSRVAPFSFMTTNGWHLSEQLSLGLGVGLEFPTGSYMPLVIDARYYIRDESFSPYFSLYGGYALPLDDNGYYNYHYWYDSSIYYEDYENLTAKGGWLINPTFGFRHMYGENFGVIFGLGYRYQVLHYAGKTDREVFMNFSRLSLKLGITFK